MTTSYGDKYWCVKVAKDVSPDGEIYLKADHVRISPEGSVMFYKGEHESSPEFITLVIPKGKWKAVYAASVLDGHAVAVEHWKGET